MKPRKTKRVWRTDSPVRVHLYLSSASLEAVKKMAADAGIPNNRFIENLIEEKRKSLA